MKKLLVLLVLVVVIPCSAKIIYVDDDSSGGDGNSWGNAYKYLQEGLANASSDPNVGEIWVGQGTYRPDETTVDPNGTGDREATFQLVNGVALLGGYAGVGEVDPNDRDWDLYETVLSGDLEGDDVGFTNNGENSYHVVTGFITNNTAVIDGFTITYGNATAIKDEFPNNSGGGMYIYDGIVKNCIFRNNKADVTHGATVGQGGGAIRCSGPAIITNCLFTGNYAGGGADGGAICVAWADPIIDKCRFVGNGSSHYGGAIRVSASSGPNIRNCLFSKNTARWGGALQFGSSHSSGGGETVIVNCTFSDNIAADYGGAIATIVTASDSLFLSSSVFWDNSAPSEIYISSRSTQNVTLNYCNVQGGLTGIDDTGGFLIWLNGNIDIDPNFVDPDNNDYHLQSQAGRYDPTTQTWLQDNYTSPCIDAGDPLTPISWEPYPNGGIVNMGAYGATVEASKSYFNTTPCEIPIAGDINGDCKVDLIDYSIMSIHWLEDNN